MLSTDTTWEVVQSFLNVPGMKGVALIDGRSRPYFQGIERVLNSQQREALAQGVWQVLETIPDDFESFEFQFAGTQVYIHKLSQNQILLVLTQDNLIYPDYFDAFTKLREAFNQDSGATLEAFQRLLGARNTKTTPINLSDVANAPDFPEKASAGKTAPSATKPTSRPLGRPAKPVSKEETLQISPPQPQGSADYAVAADISSTEPLAKSTAQDAPANPAASNSSTDAGNDLKHGNELKQQDVSPSTNIASTESARSDSRKSEDSNEELAALMDTLSLGEDDFAAPTGLSDTSSLSSASEPTTTTPPEASSSAAPETTEEEPEIALPNISQASSSSPGSLKKDADVSETFSLPDMGDSSPWDDPTDVSDLIQGAVEESATLSEENAQNLPSSSGKSTSEASSSSTTASTQPQLTVPSPVNPAESTVTDDDSYLNNRLDAIALDDDIEIDELFGTTASSETTSESSLSDDEGEVSLAVLEAYVEALNGLGEFSARYLGRAVIVNYWRTSQTGDDWLQSAFAIERSANSLRLSPDYAASRQSPITPGQQVALQAWSEKFVTRCGKVIRDFPQLAQQALSEEQSRLLDL